MSTQRQLVFYGDNKYWNPEQRKDFFDRTFNLFTPDYVGSDGRASEQELYDSLFKKDNPQLESKSH